MSNWDISRHIKGDTFNQRKITFPFDITDCKIEMQFKIDPTSSTVFYWSTVDSTFEKINSTTVIMKKRILNFPVSNYISDLQVTFLDGSVQTYLNANLQIIQDITHE